MERSTIDPLLNQYRGQRRATSTCVVIDMDAFFFSCHVLDQPHLKNIPACVGGTSMISTSNYVARKYGVRAAMPGYLGSKLVEELSGGKEKLTFVKSDFSLYKEKSSEVRAILEEYDPNLSMHSLDEAFMDIGPYLEIQLSELGKDMSHEDIQKQLLGKSHKSHSCETSENVELKQPKMIHEFIPHDTIHNAAKALLNSIRQKVKEKTGLTCSAGLCNNFLLAKIASDFNKPNGQYFVGPSEQDILEFINPLTIRKVSGIGRVMEKMLRGVCEVETVNDLYDKRAEVYYLFKPATAQFLMRACIGYAEGKHRESNEDESGDTEEALNRKGISHERTFSPTSSWSDMCTRLEGITLSLIQDMRERDLRPKTITVKVKLANFEILSRATTRDVALFQNCNNKTSSQDLVDIVINLLKEAKKEYENGGATSNATNKIAAPKATATKTGASQFSVRLLGVRCSNFQLEKDNQSSLDKYRLSPFPTDSGEIEESIDANDAPQCNNKSPKVKNPYLSPKSISPLENISHNKTKSSNVSSKRSLYTPPPIDPSNDKTSNPTDSAKDGSAAENGAQIECPICQKIFQTNNAEMNAHIDACLNASTVKELAKEETRCADERRKKKRRRLKDFFGS